jgi:hypothetical protein
MTSTDASSPGSPYPSILANAAFAKSRRLPRWMLTPCTDPSAKARKKSHSTDASTGLGGRMLPPTKACAEQGLRDHTPTRCRLRGGRTSVGVVDSPPGSHVGEDDAPASSATTGGQPAELPDDAAGSFVRPIDYHHKAHDGGYLTTDHGESPARWSR